MRTLAASILALAALVPVSMSMPGDVMTFCDATANSTGLPAVINFTGTFDPGIGEVTFMTSNVPAGNWCMIIMSYGAVDEYPFGQGKLCLNPYYPTGLYRVGSHVYATGVDEDVEVTLPVLPQLGQWHYFQTFYRDYVNLGFNASTAVGVQFDLPN
jgi:hypothetical protein